jgi:hypothetical protein
MALSNSQKRALGNAVLAQAAQITAHWDSVTGQAGYEDLKDADPQEAAQWIANAVGYLTHTSWPESLPRPSRRGGGGQSHPTAGTAAAPVTPETGVPEAQAYPHSEQAPPQANFSDAGSAAE